MGSKHGGLGCKVAYFYDCADYGGGWIGCQDQDVEDEFQAIEG